MEENMLLFVCSEAVESNLVHPFSIPSPYGECSLFKQTFHFSSARSGSVEQGLGQVGHDLLLSHLFRSPGRQRLLAL